MEQGYQTKLIFAGKIDDNIIWMSRRSVHFYLTFPSYYWTSGCIEILLQLILPEYTVGAIYSKIVYYRKKSPNEIKEKIYIANKDGKII